MCPRLSSTLCPGLSGPLETPGCPSAGAQWSKPQLDLQHQGWVSGCWTFKGNDSWKQLERFSRRSTACCWLLDPSRNCYVWAHSRRFCKCLWLAACPCCGGDLLDAHLMRCYTLTMTSSSQHPHEVGIAADPPTAGDAEGQGCCTPSSHK